MSSNCAEGSGGGMSHHLLYLRGDRVMLVSFVKKTTKKNTVFLVRLLSTSVFSLCVSRSCQTLDKICYGWVIIWYLYFCSTPITDLCVGARIYGSASRCVTLSKRSAYDKPKDTFPTFGNAADMETHGVLAGGYPAQKHELNLVLHVIVGR